jgi:hypothetical protein
MSRAIIPIKTAIENIAAVRRINLSFRKAIVVVLR